MAKRKRARARTTMISSVIVLAVVIAAWMGYRAHAAEAPGDYVTGTVTKGDVDQYLDLSGTVSEANQTSVGFPASGTVTSVDVALGDHVTAGEKLATMDDSQLKLAVIQAKADLASAKDEVTQAEQAADDSSDSSSQSSSTTGTGSPSAGSGSTGTGSTGTGSTGTGSTGTGSTGTGSTGTGSQGSGSSGRGTGSNSTGTGSQTNGSSGSGTGSKGAGTGSNSTGSTSGSNGSTGSGGQTGGSGSGAGGSGSTNPGGSEAQSKLNQLQAQLKTDTQKLSAFQTDAENASDATQSACSSIATTSPSTSPSQSSSPSPSSTPSETAPTQSPTTSPSTSPTTSPTDSPTPTVTPSSAAPTDSDSTNKSGSATTGQDADFPIGSGSVDSVDSPTDPTEACVDAIQAYQSALDTVAAQQTKLANDTANWMAAVQKAAQSTSSTGSTSGSQSTSNSQSGSATSQTPSGTSGSESGDQGSSSYQCTISQGSNATTGTTGQSASGSTSKSTGGSSSTVNPSGSRTPTGSSSSTGSSTSSSGSLSGSSSKVSSGQGSTTTVAEAKAAVTTAKINLKLAEDKLSDATITSPIDGTVASLDFTAGDSESTSDKIVITGHGAAQVTVDVPDTKLDSIKKGQQVTVGTKNSAGEVSSIGLLPASDSESSDSSYPVTITVADPADDLADGATAMAKILISRATDVIQVPVSAVTQNGTTGTVTVLKDNQPQRTQVKIGAVGSTTVQITSGLTVGETVVIADRSEPLPSSNSTTTRFGGVGGGRVVQYGQGVPLPSGTGGR